MSFSDYLSLAQIAGSLAVVLLIKPILDLRSELNALKISLYKEFVTYERLENIQGATPVPYRQARSRRQSPEA